MRPCSSCGTAVLKSNLVDGQVFVILDAYYWNDGPIRRKNLVADIQVAHGYGAARRLYHSVERLWGFNQPHAGIAEDRVCLQRIEVRPPVCNPRPYLLGHHRLTLFDDHRLVR